MLLPVILAAYSLYSFRAASYNYYRAASTASTFPVAFVVAYI